MAHFHCCSLGYLVIIIASLTDWGFAVTNNCQKCQGLVSDCCLSICEALDHYLIVWPASLIQYALLYRTWNLFDLFVDNWILIPSIKSAAGIIFNSTLHSTGSTIASLSVSYCILSKQQQQPKVLLDRFQSEPLQFKFSQWVEVDFKFKWSLISCVIFRTDQNRSPWRRSNQNQNQRRKLWSSRNGAIHSTLCTYRTQFGHWTESWLKTTSVTSCDQCWWQQWEWNLWRILICHFAMSYNGTGNQDGGSCGWQWAPKGILSRVKRLNWLCFAHTAKQKLRFG